MPKIKTHKEFINEIFNLVGNEYICLSKYINAHTKIKMKHMCGNEYEIRPHGFLNNNRCPRCSGKIKKTQEQFKKDVFNIYKDEYEVLGDYKNNKTKILIKHNVCKHEWNITPINFLQNHKCPKCFGSSKINTETFKNRVYNICENEYDILGEYENSHTKIKIKHNICNHEWDIKPYSFLNNGRKCPRCDIINRTNLKRKTHEQFIEDVTNRTQGEYTILSKYIKAMTKVRIKHNCIKCNNYEWNVTPNDFINNNSRCPSCNESKGERTIKDLLIKNNKSYTYQKKFINLLGMGGQSLSYDFYLQDYNLLIEYQGEFHDGTVPIQTLSRFKKQQEHDKRKREYALSNNIELLEIWYQDFNKIDEILSKKLNYKL